MKKVLAVVAATIFATPVLSADWAVIGAGNATCAQWKQDDRMQQAEIISWMAGFASSENLTRASEGRPEFRIEFLTPDYLRNRISETCSSESSNSQSMISIMFAVLINLPAVQNP